LAALIGLQDGCNRIPAGIWRLENHPTPLWNDGNAFLTRFSEKDASYCKINRKLVIYSSTGRGDN
jgi:hypothetical protein